MKKQYISSKLCLAGVVLAVSGMFASCDDFLTIVPTDSVPEESFWQDQADLNNVRAGAYQLLTSSDFTSRVFYWGEMRADNFILNEASELDISYVIDGTLMPSNTMFDWQHFYKGINFCNLIIEKGQTMVDQQVDPAFSQQDYNLVKSEMLALRGLYYFYLVRAFRDIPYVETALQSDAAARAFKPQAMPGVAVLGKLIDDIEGSMQYVYKNYGNSADNCGRLRERSIQMLLADMYLWRGCMLQSFAEKNSTAKNQIPKRLQYVYFSDVPVVDEATGDTTGYVLEDGTAINSTYTDELAVECFNKCIDYCDKVMAAVRDDYEEYMDKNTSSTSDVEKTQMYPLYRITTSASGTFDTPYNEIWSVGNSRESLFEVQFDAEQNTNSMVGAYFCSYSDQTATAGKFVLSSMLTTNQNSINPDNGWGQTDFRLLENLQVTSEESRKPFVKFVLQNVSANDVEDLTDNVFYQMRESSNLDTNWPIYRLADMMLIKAEAIARAGYEADSEQMIEGFHLVNELFRRYNPGLAGTNESSDVSSDHRVDRLDETYGAGKTAAALLTLVYQERQREFVGEGKRWFDLVRQCEASGDLSGTFTTYASLKASVQRRLVNYGLYSLYCPIVTTEMKVSGPDNGGLLQQNPVWDRFTEK